MSEKKNKGGRPTLYRKEYCEQLIEHMKKGLSFEAFAGKLAVNVDTLYEWAKVHSEFSDAKSTGWAMSRLFWEEHGIAGLYDQNFYENGKLAEQKKLNSTVWVFNMKNRFGWRDSVETHNNINIDGIVFSSDDDE